MNFRDYDALKDQMRTACQQFKQEWEHIFNSDHSDPNLARALLYARDHLSGAVQSITNAEAIAKRHSAKLED